MNFDGSAAIVPQTIQTINEATDTTTFPLFVTASGSQSLQPLNNTSLTFNSNTGLLSATSLGGTLTTASQTAITGVGTITTGTWNATDVAVADGGTGRSTGTTAYALVATGTTATGAQQTLANGATTEVLVGGGASALPVWTTAQGSGAPVRATSPTLVTPVLGAASATSVTFTSTNGIIGSTTNDSAAAGSVGEYVSATLASGSATALTTGVAKTVTSISLTAGDWDISGNVHYSGNSATTVGYTYSSLNTVTNTDSGTLGQFVKRFFNSVAPFGTIDNIVEPIPPIRVSLSGTTTYYLIADAGFSTNTMAAYGIIHARRVR